MAGIATTILIDGTPTNGSDPWVDSLVSGGAWADGDGGTVTIQWTAFQGTMDGQNSYAWTPTALAGLREALSLWESVANIDFVEVTDVANADAKFWWGTADQAGGFDVLGWSDLPGYSESEVLDVLFNAQDPALSGPLNKGGLGLVTMVHEIGHLLGLAHPHDGGAGWDATTFPGVDWWSPDAYGDYGLNQGIYTTMGYNWGWPSQIPPYYEHYGLQYGPMALDIAAIQAIYGANTTYASGNNVYKLPTSNGTGTYWSSIWDTGGVDTISNEGSSGKVTIDLRAATAGSGGGGYVSYGYTSSGTIVAGGYTIASGVVIENAIGGSGNDTLIGNAASNRLEGSSGSDSLDGGAGADTMIGGSGADTYYVDDSSDVITELDRWAETDIVYSSASYTLSAYIENLTLTGTASINGTGNAEYNTIIGNSGDNVLDGGGGVDYLYGGKGNDTYVIRGNQSFAIELAGEGIDTIRTSWGGTLGANLENMELLEGAWSAEGNEYDNRIVGNSGPNSLGGGLGNDTIIGGLGTDYLDGGLGADTMMGGLGSDTYYVDNLLDVVIEEGDDSQDEIFVEFTYSLIGLDKVEYLNLSRAGTANIDATGNDLKNALYGSDGNNVLDGRGGADFMMGLKGNDTYIVDDVGDYVSESVGEGNDTVRSSASSFTLHDNVENLILTGTASIGGTGNALANILTGNAGNNTLDGGAGSDVLYGQGGDDILIGGAASAGGTNQLWGGTGSDTASYAGTTGSVYADLGALAAYVDGVLVDQMNSIENLIGGSGNDTLVGDAGANVLAGKAGNDTYVIDGAGDTIVEAAGEGTDTVRASIDYTLGANLENLVLTGTGNLNGTGNTLANMLTGNAGNNVLDGGGGADTLAGKAGNDTYVVDVAGDIVVEAVGEGTDTVRASISWTLGDNVENLELTGSSDVDGIGNALDNWLTGNAGTNVLLGKAGNDTYVIDSAADMVVEAAGAGTDTVRASIDYTLGANLENLVLTGTGNLNGTGNELKNVLTGNAGNNVLEGGAGADTMTGGAGDDTYVVDSGADVVIELAAGGTDTVMSSITWTLGAALENLTLTGTGAISAYGNELANTLRGTGGNNTLDGGAGADTMVGGLGNDVYVVDNAGDVVIEAADAGTDTVRATVSYTLSANVEKLTLSGTAHLNGTGNELANTILGNDGNNVLDGGAGGDTLVGGLGNDTYIVDDAGDILSEDANAGLDAVQSSVTYRLRANFENLTLTGVGNLNGTGNELANVLVGNAGNNVLDGGAGADTMTGGLGDDTYVMDVSTDKVTELAGQGIDTVQAAFTYVLRANFENLTLTGAADISAVGNTVANVLTGNAGNNVLDGGTGADTMRGGLGNDTYVVENAGDVVIEAAGQGTDAVRAWVDYTLTANVEKLTLYGTANLSGTGNELANALVGNAGNNILDGGLGADTMTGGAGDDTYIVENSGDRASEDAGGGIDTILASVTHMLKANVENLTLTGSAAINAVGNGEANVLTGNAANNILDGGAGADEMAGGDGNDTYVVENAGDIVVELADQGTDAVRSWISYTLGANIEKLTLYGTANIDGTGNELVNSLFGNTGHNILDGGLGADTLTGNGGGDTFRFSTALGASNVDRITAFDHAGDTIQLDDAIFASLGTGALAAGAFNTGSVATQADDRILYDAASKSLYYDADGAGGTAAVKFATIGTLTGTLDHTDFFVV